MALKRIRHDKQIANALDLILLNPVNSALNRKLFQVSDIDLIQLIIL